jgi:hypothetical protein
MKTNVYTMESEIIPQKLDVIDQCTFDNWGMPNQKNPPYRKGYNTEIQEACRIQFENNENPMSEIFETATLNFYKNNADFDQFIGIDMVPENHYLFKSGSPWGSKLDTTSVPPKTMRGSTCELELEDGTYWTINRIGPFKTHGGYDWTQMGWDNLWNLREKLEKYTDGIYVLDQFSSPVLKDGTRLGNPPIHVHHIHIGPRPGVRQRGEAINCLLNDHKCYDPTRVLEHHGDYEGRKNDVGLDLFSESIPEGYGKLITFQLGLEGDLNDVRPTDSDELEWYYELGGRWVPKNHPAGKNVKPVSFHNFAGPGEFIPGVQSTYIFTFKNPTKEESIFWYSGRMHHSALMLRNKQHAHNAVYNEAIFFSATPEELGLTRENNLYPEHPSKVILTSTTGFENNTAVRKFILDNLKESINKPYKYIHRRIESSNDFGEYGKLQNEDSINYINDYPGRKGRPPKAVCHAINNIEYAEDGYGYDRKEPTCCVNWEFDKGEIFTVVAFNGKLKKGIIHKDEMPEFFPGHIGWWLSFDTRETPAKSHFSITQYTNNPDYQYDAKSLRQLDHKVYIYLNHGTPDLDSVWLRIVGTILIFMGRHIYASISLISGLFFGIIITYSRIKNSKRRKKIRDKLCNLEIITGPSIHTHEL